MAGIPPMILIRLGSVIGPVVSQAMREVLEGSDREEVAKFIRAKLERIKSPLLDDFVRDHLSQALAGVLVLSTRSE